MTTPLMITLADCVLLAQLPGYEPLRRKLERAVVVSSEAVPPDLATMSSRLRYTDGAEARVARLAYPARAGGPGLLSVLTPMGAALLGLTAGQAVDYAGADGVRRRLRLHEVLDQPERALHRRSVDERLDEDLELIYPASDAFAVSS